MILGDISSGSGSGSGFGSPAADEYDDIFFNIHNPVPSDKISPSQQSPTQTNLAALNYPSFIVIFILIFLNMILR